MARLPRWMRQTPAAYVRAAAVALVVLLLGVPPVQAQAPCQFILGFATLRDLIGPQIVGDCLEDQHFAENGDALQRTTRGLMVWRKSDNWTAFTDGFRTWVNGPFGVQQRLNTERFPWEVTVRMEDNYFVPVELTVPPGTTVIWVNAGREDHTVVAKDLSYDSGVIRPGQQFQRRYDAPGEYPYICDLHEGMEGKIIVQ